MTTTVQDRSHDVEALQYEEDGIRACLTLVLRSESMYAEAAA